MAATLEHLEIRLEFGWGKMLKDLEGPSVELRDKLSEGRGRV